MEIWKDIYGFKGLYQISNTGKVKALYKERINGRGGIRIYPEKIMKPSTTHRGYLLAVLCKKGKMYYFLVHRLVAKAFVANPKRKKEVNHKDGNKLNNNDWNLEWNTRKENAKHAYDTGLFNNKRDLKTGKYLKNEEGYI
jgi:hypothetical protein